MEKNETILGQIAVDGPTFNCSVPECSDCPQEVPARIGITGRKCKKDVVRSSCDKVLAFVICHSHPLQDTYITLALPGEKKEVLVSSPLSGKSNELAKNQCFMKTTKKATGLIDAMLQSGIVRMEKTYYETGSGPVQLVTLRGVPSTIKSKELAQ